jgi:predicted nucleic acid-binding protein
MSALLGGLARRILFDGRYEFVIPERITWEVKRYLPVLARKSGVSEEEVLTAFEQMPLEAVGDSLYAARFADVARLGLRDRKDQDLVALALVLDVPIWSHDKDLLSLSGVTVFVDGDLSSDAR